MAWLTGLRDHLAQTTVSCVCGDDEAIEERQLGYELPDDVCEAGGRTIPDVTQEDRLVWSVMVSIRPFLRFFRI